MLGKQFKTGLKLDTVNQCKLKGQLIEEFFPLVKISNYQFVLRHMECTASDDVPVLFRVGKFFSCSGKQYQINIEDHFKRFAVLFVRRFLPRENCDFGRKALGHLWVTFWGACFCESIEAFEDTWANKWPKTQMSVWLNHHFSWLLVSRCRSRFFDTLSSAQLHSFHFRGTRGELFLVNLRRIRRKLITSLENCITLDTRICAV